MSVSRHDYLIKSASYLSVFIAIIILVVKSYAWFITESQSILATLIDSMLDISSSLINLTVIRFSLQPADNNYRFGHDKFQDLAVFSQSIFFCATGLFTFASAVKFMFYQRSHTSIDIGTYSMYICIVFTSILVAYQYYVIKITNSMIIKADKLHYFTDLIANIAVIISINLSSIIWFIDPLFAIGIAIYILNSSYKLFRKSVKNLVDEEFSDKEREKILFIISKYEEVQGVHELKTRYAANKPFIQFHLEVDGSMSLYDAHLISDRISDELLTIFHNGEITIHQDPAGVESAVNYREKLK